MSELLTLSTGNIYKVIYTVFNKDLKPTKHLKHVEPMYYDSSTTEPLFVVDVDSGEKLYLLPEEINELTFLCTKKEYFSGSEY